MLSAELRRWLDRRDLIAGVNLFDGVLLALVRRRRGERVMPVVRELPGKDTSVGERDAHPAIQPGTNFCFGHGGLYGAAVQCHPERRAPKAPKVEGQRSMESDAPFIDRAAAGRELAGRLLQYKGRSDTLVLALPRGGVPVGFEVARALQLPLDVVVVRKLGVPGREELAMGALASPGLTYIDRWLVDRLEISREDIEAVVARERKELLRRERAYRDDRPAPVIRDRVLICVDDGLATGASMRAAVGALREGHPAKIVVAVPVAAAPIAAELQSVADDVVVVRMPRHFRAVSLWYADFSQTTDAEVRDLLARSLSR